MKTLYYLLTLISLQTQMNVVTSMFILQKRAARTFFKLTCIPSRKYIIQVRNNMRVKDEDRRTLRRIVNRKSCGVQRTTSAGLSFSPGCQSQLDECPWDVASHFPSCLAVIHMSGQLITEWSREWRCRCLFWSLPKFYFNKRCQCAHFER